MITARDKANCAWRELKQRQRVYERWVSEKRMTRQFADKELRTMEAIARDYDKLAEEKERAGRLL